MLEYPGREEPEMVIIVLIAVAAWAFLALFAVAMCKAAASADARSDQVRGVEPALSSESLRGLDVLSADAAMPRSRSSEPNRPPRVRQA